MRGVRGFFWVKLVAVSFFAMSTVVACSDDATPTGPKVTVTGSHSVKVGDALTLSVSTADGQDTSYTWASSDATIATVSSTGAVTGVKAGEVTITATGDQTNVAGDHPVVVTDPAGGDPAVQVTGSSASVAVNATLKLTASTVNGTDASYTWTSSDADVGTVAADGTVTGVSSGSVTITATGSDTTASGSMTLLVVVAVIPSHDKWLTSGHADRKAEAFTHWDEDDPAEIPTSCARCHSTPGYRDYLGDDGTDAGVVNNAASIGTVVECEACHNAAAQELESVTFPSGVKITMLGAEARCMTCHQGNASNDSVDDDVVTAAELDVSDITSDTDLTDDEKREAIRARIDTQVDADVVPSPTDADDKLGFVNIHYYAAGATLNAGRVRGGFQYSGKVYDWRFRHVPNKETCIGCHDSHSLGVKLNECKVCHTAVDTLADLKDIRMIASMGSDYDGDGDLTEGIFHEVEGLRTKLLTAITNYPTDKILPAICYSPTAYPYFFIDTDANGECSAGEANYGNQYVDWTPRLLRAAYNYQVASKDPGVFAHNAKYVIQLLYDAIMDLNGAMGAANRVDMTQAVRNDPGHFNGAGEAARHWDEDEQVSPSCSKCHGGSEGLHFFAVHGVGTVVVEPDNGLDCKTCHKNVGPTYELLRTTSVEEDEQVDPFEPIIDSVTYPSKITITDSGNASNICATCHSGRESGVTIDEDIAAAVAASKTVGFANVHYKPAAAVRKGDDAQVGYQYAGNTYVGEWTAHSGGTECVECHSPANTNHSFAIADNLAACQLCHPTATQASDIRNVARQGVDYDGDGDSDESLHDELLGLADRLMIEINAQSGAAKVCYRSGYPYFVKADAASGHLCTQGERSAYAFDPATEAGLLRAGHNYQIAQKEPGAWAHNFDYIHQLLYDSLVDLGVDVTPTGLDLPKPPGR